MDIFPKYFLYLSVQTKSLLLSGSPDQIPCLLQNHAVTAYMFFLRIPTASAHNFLRLGKEPVMFFPRTLDLPATGIKANTAIVTNEELEQKGQIPVSFDGLHTWASLYNGRLSVKAEASNIRKVGMK